MNRGRRGVADNFGGSSGKWGIGATGGGWVRTLSVSGQIRIHIDHNTTAYLARLDLAPFAARFEWCGVVFGNVGGGRRAGSHLGECWPDPFGLVLAAGVDIVAVMVAAVMIVVVVVVVVVMVRRRAVETFARRGRRRHRVGR